MRVTREFRFFLPADGSFSVRTDNAWGGWNVGVNLLPFLTLQLTVNGKVDPASGYLCDIRQIDNAIRDSLQSRGRGGEESKRYDRFLQRAFEEAARLLPENVMAESMRLVVSPFMSLSVSAKEQDMVYWTHQAEFSAAHRLHCHELSDEENRAMFGKCNNPAGHGHNYVVEVTVKYVPGDSGKTAGFSPVALEQQIANSVIHRLDHKHLNQDVGEFSELNPSVENIASVIWKWLEGTTPNSILHNVRVYETPKTWADCDGD